MSHHQTRRTFVKCALVGVGMCCPLLACRKKEEAPAPAATQVDYSNFAYCGLECANCDLYKATQTNNVAEKKRLAKLWFGVEEKDFKEEAIFCYTCKAEDQPQNQFIQQCQVRPCAKEKNLPTCAHCDQLPTCDKEFWKNFPEQKQKMEAMRKTLVEA